MIKVVRQSGTAQSGEGRKGRTGMRAGMMIRLLLPTVGVKEIHAHHKYVKRNKCYRN